MTDRESEIARKVTRYLDRGVADLRSGTLYRLQQARAAAMTGVASRTTGAELATAGTAAMRSVNGRPGGWNSPLRLLGVVLLVAAFGFGFQQWRAIEQVHEFEELDLRLLASDLPIDAYLDRGFQNWLRTASDH